MTKENQTQPVSGAMTDCKAEFESWASKDGSYDLRPAKWKVQSVGGVPYDGYVRPYLQDRTVYTYQGFEAGFNAAILSRAQDAQAVRNAALEASSALEGIIDLVDGTGLADNVAFAACLDAITAIERALQSAPAQPVERPDAVELPPLPAWAESEYLFRDLTASDVASELKQYALAAIAANQPQQVRGNAQEPESWLSYVDCECTDEQDKALHIVSGFRAGQAYNALCHMIGGRFPDSKIENEAPAAHQFFMEIFGCKQCVAKVSLSAAPQVAQEQVGYKLVPIEPSGEMIAEGGKAFDPEAFNHRTGASIVWDAMLAAAPQSDAQQSIKKDARYCTTCERTVTEPCSSVDCSTPEKPWHPMTPIEEALNAAKTWPKSEEVKMFYDDIFTLAEAIKVDRAIAKEQGR